MSRSFKKTKIFGNASNSDKQSKRKANRKLRKAISNVDLLETEVLPKIRDVSSTWGFAKDGKHYWAKATEKDMRK